MSSGQKGLNNLIKTFRKCGQNKHFNSSTKQKSDVCIVSLEKGFLAKNTVESVRRVITRELNRSGKISIPLSFTTPTSKKPSGIRMGKGKGKVDKLFARCSFNTIILEVSTYNISNAVKALEKSLHKLPIKSFVKIKAQLLF